MNEHDIETLLRKAPQPAPPSALRNRLCADIEVTTAGTSDHGCARLPHRASWMRRWMPAIGFAAWFITCVVVLGVQAARIAELESNRDLEQSAAAAKAKELAAAALAESQAKLQEAHAAKAEAERLRAEVAELRARAAETARLQAENARLRAELAAKATAAAATTAQAQQDFFVVQKDRAERAACINNIKQVGLAARIWANDSKTDLLPTDFEALKPHLNGADRLLVCPSDQATRYTLVSPGASERNPNVVFVRCPVHNNVGMVDGSAQMLNPNIPIVQKDGVWVIGR